MILLLGSTGYVGGAFARSFLRTRSLFRVFPADKLTTPTVMS